MLLDDAVVMIQVRLNGNRNNRFITMNRKDNSKKKLVSRNTLTKKGIKRSFVFQIILTLRCAAIESLNG